MRIVAKTFPLRARGHKNLPALVYSSISQVAVLMRDRQGISAFDKPDPHALISMYLQFSDFGGPTIHRILHDFSNQHD